MKKKYWLLLILAILFYVPNTYAFDSNNYRYKGLCGTFEVTSLKRDGSIEAKGCYGSYNEAKNYMTSIGTEDLVIMTKVNGETAIIDANYALLDLTANQEGLTYYYTNSDLSGSAYTYMDNSYSYGGVDGLHVDSTYSSRSGWVAKVQIANFTGWIKKSAYEIVPLTWVNSASHYIVSNDDIRHTYITRVQNDYSNTYGRTIGPKPSMLPVGTYYSYDGHYFYTDLATLIRDVKNNTHNNSVNKNNAYYNYYMYLSNHTKTSYSSININEYIRNNMGYYRNVYGNAAGSGASRLYGMGTFFYHAQEKYGVNAILSLSLSRNETGNGRSNLAINKNNGFGLNAVDSNPTQAANWYATFSNSILGYASKWITYGYAHPRDWRYYGPQFGDKWIGMNVKYASDTYWSEKMAANYYSLDKAFGLQDYDNYQLGVVNARMNSYLSPSYSSKVPYIYTEKEDTVVIVDEVEMNNEKWYKVISDLNMDSNGNEITSGPYNWHSYVYVPTSQVTKINTAKNGYMDPNNIIEYEDQDYEYDLYIENAELKPKVAVTVKDTPYYYESTLTTKTGSTLLNNHYVMVYTAAYQNGVPVSYLVTSDYWHDQKEWVSADSIRFVTSAYGRANVKVSGNQYTWVNYNTEDASYSVIGGLYDYTYVPILETLNVNGVIWYKVPVNLTGNDNVTGYTLAHYSNDVFIKEYSYTSGNNQPVIIAKDKTLIEQDSFDPKKDVTASDAEDGDLTSKIEIIENTVNTRTPGVYKVTYKVKDSTNNEIRLTIKVTVKENKAPEITASDKKLYVGDTFKPLDNVKANDPEDGDLTSKIKVVENTVNTKKEGTYKVIYEVTDNRNKKTTKEIKVIVKEKIDINLDTLKWTDLEKLQEKESIFFYDYLKEVNNNLEIKGYNVIRGINNNLDTNISYVLAFISLDNNKVYMNPINRIKDKAEITRPVNSTDKEDYSYSWFKGNINLKDIPDGDYKVYIISISEEGEYSKSVISNTVLRTQVASYEGDKTVTTRNNYLDDDIALEFIIRSEKIEEKTTKSVYNIYNQYRTLEFNNNNLHIKGTSYSYGMNLSKSTKVERKLILENTSNYKKYSYDLSSIDNGLYVVGTTLGDKLDKDRAWFDKEVDISSLPKGEYAIYISTISNVKDYGELTELLGKDLSKITATINNKKYSFSVNKDKRYRIELKVE